MHSHKNNNITNDRGNAMQYDHTINIRKTINGRTFDVDISVNVSFDKYGDVSHVEDIEVVYNEPVHVEHTDMQVAVGTLMVLGLDTDYESFLEWIRPDEPEDDPQYHRGEKYL